MIELDIELLLWIINVYDSGHTIERSRSNEKLLNVGAVSVGQRHSQLVPTQPTSYRSRSLALELRAFDGIRNTRCCSGKQLDGGGFVTGSC